MANYRNPKLRASAKGKDCQMAKAMNDIGILVKWSHDPATVVWCHSNSNRHGKGIGLKANDLFGFYACAECHSWFDKESFREARTFELFLRAWERSLIIACKEGLI